MNCSWAAVCVGAVVCTVEIGWRIEDRVGAIEGGLLATGRADGRTTGAPVNLAVGS